MVNEEQLRKEEAEEARVRLRASGPYVVWHYHAYEGWHPWSYDTLREAVESKNEYGSGIWVIQRPVHYTVDEVKNERRDQDQHD